MKKLINYTNQNKKNIILIISLLLFTIVTYTIFNNNIIKLDNLTHSYILNIRNNSLTNIMKIITNIASSITLITLTILLIIIFKNKKIPLYISLNLIFSFTSSQIAKLIFTRDRPLGINLIEVSGFSYPSGHSMVSMAYFGFITYLIYKYCKNKKIKIISIITLFTTIILVGFSRIYLGVHYLSDVIGGFLLAIIYLIIFIKIINLKKKNLN